jgi:hypothetical protein
MQRRAMIMNTLALCFSLAVLSEAGPLRRRRRRRIRRRVRRRIRRRVAFRGIAGGGKVLIVPAGIVAGWELVIKDKVYVVHEVKTIKVDGAPTEVVVVKTGNGKLKNIHIIKEDTKENSKNIKGSELSKDDKDIPFVDEDEEVEE